MLIFGFLTPTMFEQAKKSSVKVKNFLHLNSTFNPQDHHQIKVGCLYFENYSQELTNTLSFIQWDTKFNYFCPKQSPLERLNIIVVCLKSSKIFLLEMTTELKRERRQIKMNWNVQFVLWGVKISILQSRKIQDITSSSNGDCCN